MRPCLALAAALLGFALAAERADAQVPRGLGDLGGRPEAEAGTPVDVELVLAVDVSWSMDLFEQEIQREGYAAAFRSAEVQRAILDGNHGRVAVAYVEWAGATSQSVVVPWTLIDSRESAESFAWRLGQSAPIRARRTSIAAAIDYAVPMFEGNGFVGQRRVVDVSGDGPNNQGPFVEEARDRASAAGITVNGLPLMTGGESGPMGWGAIAHLDRYYADCVIGGPGAFSIPVTSWEEFPRAVRRKLVLELAGRWPEPVGEPAARIVLVQSEAPSDCRIGERMWQERQRIWMEGVP